MRWTLLWIMMLLCSTVPAQGAYIPAESPPSDSQEEDLVQQDLATVESWEEAEALESEAENSQFETGTQASEEKEDTGPKFTSRWLVGESEE